MARHRPLCLLTARKALAAARHPPRYIANTQSHVVGYCGVVLMDGSHQVASGTGTHALLWLCCCDRGTGPVMCMTDLGERVLLVALLCAALMLACSVSCAQLNYPTWCRLCMQVVAIDCEMVGVGPGGQRSALARCAHLGSSSGVGLHSHALLPSCLPAACLLACHTCLPAAPLQALY